MRVINLSRTWMSLSDLTVHKPIPLLTRIGSNTEIIIIGKIQMISMPLPQYQYLENDI